VGLRGMRERIIDLGGTFEVDSNENGTTVRVNLPLGVTTSFFAARRCTLRIEIPNARAVALNVVAAILYNPRSTIGANLPSRANS
jgi:hypothetical protein